MTDNQGRTIDYLRISVTDRCNLRCIYCMPEEGIESISHSQIMTFDEIVRVCRILAEYGLKKIKITGGEPLVRKNVVWLIRELKNIPGIENVTITTNGVLLKEYYDALVEAGIDAITVSLDTLRPEIYRKITRRDALEQVLESLRFAVNKGHVRLKINCVPVLDMDEQAILELLAYVRGYDIDLRFIEMMPIGLGKQFTFVSEDRLRSLIGEKFGPMTLYCERRGNGPCRYYDVPGFVGKIGFISALSHKFCGECNRVRLTADGFLKTCLQYDCGAALKQRLTDGVTDEELWNVMREAILQKPKAHHFEIEQRTAEDEARGMSQIGG